MALAVLEFKETQRDAARFTIDTGTSPYYELRIGQSVERRNGADWVDEVTWSTPIRTNPNSANLFNSRLDVALPASRLGGSPYVQLFSFKGADRRAPTYSNVVQVAGAWADPEQPRLPFRMERKVSQTASFDPARRIAHTHAAERYARSTSLDDVLAGIVKLATPIVEQLLGGAGGKPGAAAGSAGAPADGGGTGALGNVLALLLEALVGDGHEPAAATQSLSLAVSPPAPNRFMVQEYARPFIFGIDDALIGAIAGPVLQMLPQLMNAANQRKIQMRQADDKLVSDLVAGINQRLMLQQLAGAQPPAAAPADLAKLAALLQQSGAGSAAPAADGGAVPAAAQSLSMSAADGATLSTRAVVGFVLADALPWNGTSKPLFAKAAKLRLQVSLTVGAPVPSSTLPKSIIRIVFKDAASHAVIVEKTFKRKDVAANTPLVLEFAPEDTAAMPVNRPIEVVADMRWLTPKTGEVYKALGSREIVFVNQYLLKSQGSTVASEIELTDMKQYRSFWNKLWESPVLDATSASSRDDKKFQWEFDMTARYSVVLSAQQDSNGLMESKLLKAADDPDSLTQRVAGRMKGGIELSVKELNKLLHLWHGHDALPAAQSEALATESFAAANAGEAITSLKLKGSAGERGMIWAVPVFNLVQCTLAKVLKTDDNGQVTALADEVVGFPMPVAARLIGLKSKQ